MFGLQKLISFKDTLKCFFGIFVDDLDCKKNRRLIIYEKNYTGLQFKNRKN